jgi:hypothetical protein
MYKFTHIIQEKVSAMEYMKLNEERIKLLEKGLEEIGDKYLINHSGSHVRKKFASVINQFCFQNINLDDLENISNIQFNNLQQSITSIMVRDCNHDKERIWLLHESGEWVINHSLEKITKEAILDSRTPVLGLHLDGENYVVLLEEDFFEMRNALRGD